MDCEKALELMSAELDGMCTEQERAALQAHLEACADCRETYRQLRALDEALQDAELEPPQALHDNVMRQIRKEKKRPGRSSTCCSCGGRGPRRSCARRRMRRRRLARGSTA